MSDATLDLSTAELDEMIGDGSCTHLPQVRMALEIRRRRSSAAERIASVVRQTVHERIACVAGWDGFAPGSINRMVEDIATRVATRLIGDEP